MCASTAQMTNWYLSSFPSVRCRALGGAVGLLSDIGSDVLQYHQYSSSRFHLRIVILDPKDQRRPTTNPDMGDSHFIFFESQSLVESFRSVIAHLHMCHCPVHCLSGWSHCERSSGIRFVFGRNGWRGDGRVDGTL